MSIAQRDADPMSIAQTSNTLVTIPISHYCEKARWALDRAGVSYRERAHVQAIHRAATLRAGGGLTVPVFVCAAGVLSDSADILAWSDRQVSADRALYPEDPAACAEVRRLEADFDTRLGPASRRWLYQQLRDRRDLALRYGSAGIPRWEHVTLRWAYPVLIGIVARVLDVTPATSAVAETEVRAVFDVVGERLADGRRYLCGERFSAADLTFSALAAPMLMPAGYGVALPPPEELPTYAASVVRELRTHPAGIHALTMFDTERPARHPERPARHPKRPARHQRV
jgi:glutathione S-transferase